MSGQANERNGCQGGRGFGAIARSGLCAPPERLANRQFAIVPQEFICRLKTSWTYLKKSENVRQILISYLESCGNPYAVALQIASDSDDLYHNKANTLAAYVIEEFCAWSKVHEEKILHNLTTKLKLDAFCMITEQKNHSLTKAIIETFKMVDEKMIFVDKIRTFVHYKKYKEACQCAVALDLMNEFSVDEMILPLVFQDKLSVAEEALKNHPGLQRELISRLDQLVGERSLRNSVEHLIIQLDVPDVKKERFINHKALGRLVAKLAKTFNLPADATPHLNQKRSAGALNYLFGKRFFEKTLSIESWREMAYDAVKDNDTLQADLVLNLTSYNEIQEALYWAIKFDVPQQKWPHIVYELFRQNPLANHEFPMPASADDQETEDWSESYEYHTLDLPDSAIHMIDTEERLLECFSFINNHDCKIVGIDSEWKPAFGAQQNELSLIQLATWDRIFILDVIGMSGISPTAWQEGARLFFENPDILKLGFSLASDMVMIKSSVAPLANIKLNGCGYLDLSTVWRKLQNKGLTFPYSGENTNSGGESLSRLVSLCFNRSLNKQDQFSNWEQRPLRIGQKRYAALDAYCLLQLYMTIQKLSDEQGLPFLEVCDELIMGFRSPKKNLVPAGSRGRGRGRRPPGSGSNPGQGPSRSQGRGYYLPSANYQT